MKKKALTLTTFAGMILNICAAENQSSPRVQTSAHRRLLLAPASINLPGQSSTHSPLTSSQADTSFASRNRSSSAILPARSPTTRTRANSMPLGGIPIAQYDPELRRVLADVYGDIEDIKDTTQRITEALSAYHDEVALTVHDNTATRRRLDPAIRKFERSIPGLESKIENIHSDQKYSRDHLKKLIHNRTIALSLGLGSLVLLQIGHICLDWIVFQ